MLLTEALRGVRRSLPVGLALLMIGGCASDPSIIDPRSFVAAGNWPLEQRLRAAAIAPDGSFVVMSWFDNHAELEQRSQLQLLDLPSGERSHITVPRPDFNIDVGTQYSFMGEARSLAVSPDSTRVAASWSGATLVVPVAEPAASQAIRHRQGNQSPYFNDLDFTGDGARLVGIGIDLRLLDLTAGTSSVLSELPAGAGGSRLDMAADGQLATISSAGAIAIAQLSPETGAAEPRCALETEASALAFSPDGRLLAAALRDNTLQVLQTSDCSELSRWPTGTRFVPSLAWLADGEHLVTGAGDGQVRIWRASDQSLVHTLAHGEGTTQVLLSADGSRLVTISLSGEQSLILWQASLL